MAFVSYGFVLVRVRVRVRAVCSEQKAAAKQAAALFFASVLCAGSFKK
jgi:hypothetical protein